MKNQKMYLIQLVTLIIFLFLGSCNNDKLSNSKAKKLLKNEYTRYATSTIQLNDFSLSPSVPNELKLLSARGLATYNYIPPGTRGYGCYGQLTEFGSQYQIGKINNQFIIMAIAKVDFDKILGIKEIPMLNTAEVEYSEKIIEITPAGEIYYDISIGKTNNVTATFVKYNDGWRLEQMSTNAKKAAISENIQQSNQKKGQSLTDSKGLTETNLIPFRPNRIKNFESFDLNKLVGSWISITDNSTLKISQNNGEYTIEGDYFPGVLRDGDKATLSLNNSSDGLSLSLMYIFSSKLGGGGSGIAINYYQEDDHLVIGTPPNKLIDKNGKIWTEGSTISTAGIYGKEFKRIK
ncbi:MAG: hypothetical protein KKG99_13885 [Bacteroidetes bacterium]|nr:hypothetical protein [Bacteroidota bacterium]